MSSSPLRRPPKHTPVLAQAALVRLGQRVVLARKLREMTQETLAQLSDVSLTTLRALESGADGVSVGNVAKVLQGLGTLEQLDSLLDPRQDPEVLPFAQRRLGERR